MLKIDSNQSIRLSRGDDAKLPLFINCGTAYKPIRYYFRENMGCEIYFALYELNDDADANPIITYVIKDNGDIIVKVKNEREKIIHNVKNINDNGDMIIRFAHEDTANIEAGEYRYKIRAKLLDKTENDEHYIINTITNKLPFYLINDDFAFRNWSR